MTNLVRALLSLSLCLALAACSDDSSTPSADANGPYDLTEADILAIFNAINAECGGTSAASPTSTEECLDVCDCSATALAGLEGNAESPRLVEACAISCEPDFTATADLPIPADDADDEPEYESFFEAYIVKCDEIANQTVFTDGSFTEECTDICVCLSDAIEQYVSPTADDTIRSGCEAACAAPPVGANG